MASLAYRHIIKESSASIAAVDHTILQDGSVGKVVNQSDKELTFVYDSTVTTPGANDIKLTSGGGSWVSVDVTGGDMVAATYDPTTVAGDAFDMDNMVEGTSLILTAAERTIIGNTSNTNTGDQNAAGVSVADASGYFTGTDVEAVLQELAASYVAHLVPNLFFAKKSSQQILGFTLADVTGFDTAEYDDTDYTFNATTGVLTINTTGIYELNMTVLFILHTGTRFHGQAQMVRNGTLIPGMVCAGYGRTVDEGSTGHVSKPIALTATDTLKMQARAWGTIGAINTTGAYDGTSFWLKRIG